MLSSMFIDPSKKAKPLSEAGKQLLRQQPITENSPGTILLDFQTMLELLQPNGIEISGTNSLLPMKSLAGINQKLSHPIDIKLARPQQKSYPYINGLYLLLRASGLSQLTIQGKKQLLILDAEVLRSWATLNPSERYFNLLEIWLRRSDAEILGSYRDPFGMLFRLVAFWSRIPDRGITYESYQRQEDLRLPELYNVALLELFGFIAIEQGETENGKGWRIKHIHCLPFGNAMMDLLVDICGKTDFESWLEQESTNNYAIGEWQPAIKPFFPEWERNIEIPIDEFQEGIFVFKVSLAKACRRIAIPSHLNLDFLSGSILDAFDFDCDHLYEFSYKDRFGIKATVHHPYMEDAPSTDEVLIGDLPLKPGDSMIFHFDFGDDWEFQVLLEQIDPPDAKVKKPKILESHGKAPKQYSD
jgi:Plasmid pRiA4b ORF-3-like protein